MTISDAGTRRPRGANALDRCMLIIDRLVEWLGRLTAWLTLGLVLLVAGDVMLRYIWHTGSVASRNCSGICSQWSR
ncbi:hypothetical protein [Kushneria phosphatilytica]|uniref:hypothetical protein n=1 Tax=Kushneria phosphatilytica TaxID=657387 RepID=UPI001981F1AB|nr:hypothetical protein [Kushneria phosphatilytica]